MKTLWLILITLFVMVLTGYVMAYYLGRISRKYSVAMRFNQWVKMYYVKPSNWNLYWPYVEYNNGSTIQFVNITFLSSWKLLWFLICNKRNKYEKEDIEKMRTLLEYIQKDINDVKEESERQIQEYLGSVTKLYD